MNINELAILAQEYADWNDGTILCQDTNNFVAWVDERKVAATKFSEHCARNYIDSLKMLKFFSIHCKCCPNMADEARKLVAAMETVDS